MGLGRSPSCDEVSPKQPQSKSLAQSRRTKTSRIPVYSKKIWESGVSKEFVRVPCECGKDSIASPTKRGWRMEGHAIYCPKAAIAYRCYLNNRLETLFRTISKRKYCGNIIDASSHGRWMRLAGIYQDEDASHFKKFAKNRVVLPISEYKSGLQKMCEECNMEYWDVIRRMTSIDLGAVRNKSPNVDSDLEINSYGTVKKKKKKWVSFNGSVTGSV
ncbi:uncharacterized protein NPIL_681141 [Nephila pilipes]|uniref:Uncharacterized protein n=1 Tax=Nephila pilipes TaxID=299642 RepID=A0A8X6MVI1_NEPPI|nr:uncharacterized protein NPIL_681141 [Nephila pilipes]